MVFSEALKSHTEVVLLFHLGVRFHKLGETLATGQYASKQTYLYRTFLNRSYKVLYGKKKRGMRMIKREGSVQPTKFERESQRKQMHEQTVPELRRNYSKGMIT